MGQKSRQLWSRRFRANWRVANGKTEEVSETQGLDIRRDTLQRAPEDLVTHIDAKRRLHGGGSTRGRRTALRRCVQQRPLVGDFLGTLPDRLCFGCRLVGNL